MNRAICCLLKLSPVLGPRLRHVLYRGRRDLQLGRVIGRGVIGRGGGDGLRALLAIGLFVVPLSAQQRMAAEVLTLRTSLDRASKNNPRLQLAQKDFEIAKAQLKQARSLFFPRVSVNMDAVRYKHETLALTPPEIGNVVLETDRASNGQIQGADNLFIGRLNFVQTLYAGGKVTYTHKLSRANVQRAQSSFESLQNEVAFQTAEAFYGLVALKEKRRLANAALLDVEKMIRQADSLHNRLAATTARHELRSRLSSIEQLEKELRFKYLSALGVEYFSEVDVDGQLEPRLVDQDLQTLLVWAKQNRAELKETVIQEEVDALSVDLSLAERYPVFRLGGGVEVRNNTWPLDQTNWNAVLDMNIPIFDGLSSPARVRESRYRAEQGRIRRSQLEDAVDAEVRAAKADIEHWSTELTALREEKRELDEAQRNYSGARASQGLANRVDYLRWKLDRDIDVVEGKLQLCLASARLHRALGRSILSGE